MKPLFIIPLNITPMLMHIKILDYKIILISNYIACLYNDCFIVLTTSSLKSKCKIQYQGYT